MVSSGLVISNPIPLLNMQEIARVLVDPHVLMR